MSSTSSARIASAASSNQSRRSTEVNRPPKLTNQKTLRRSASKRNSTSSAGSRAGSANTTGNPLPPPPIIQVGEGDNDPEVVVDVNAAKRSSAGRLTRSGSGLAKKRDNLVPHSSSTKLPTSSAFASPLTRRSPPDYTKRWSPPPFPNVSSSSSHGSSKSELSASATSLISTTSRRPSFGDPTSRTQLSLPNSLGPKHSLSAGQMTSYEAMSADAVRSSASAPNLSAAFVADRDKAVSPIEEGVSEFDEEYYGHFRSERRSGEGSPSDDDEEDAKPFLSFTEMSIAISRWNHVIEDQTIYGDAKRPILFSGDIDGGSRVPSSSRRYLSRPSAATTVSSVTTRSPLRKTYPKPAHFRRDAAPKNRSKTVPAGGIKSSFFGAGDASRSSAASASSPVKSSFDHRASRVPRLALNDHATRRHRSRNEGEDGIHGHEIKDWEAQLPSEMKKIYRHFKSYDETPRLRRGGNFQVRIVIVLVLQNDRRFYFFSDP